MKFLPTRQQIGLIIGAFLLAFLLWLFVTSQKNFTAELDVPIEVRNIQSRKTLRHKIPRTAVVRFNGTGRALLKARLLKDFFDLKLVVDLERMRTEYDFILNEYFERYPQKIYIPSSFAINYLEVVYPDSLHISLDDIMTKEVPVISNMLLAPAPGYLLVGEPRIDPQEVQISGPKELVGQISQVLAVSDTIDNLDITLNRKLDLTELDRLIHMSVNEIEYYQDVQAIGERIISEIAVEVTNILPDLRVFVNPRTVALTITGGIDQIATIQPEDIRVEINFAQQWTPRQQFYEPTVTPPAGLIGWSDLSPRNLELVVTRK